MADHSAQADELGSGSGNAEQLIGSSRARYQGALGEAQLLDEIPGIELDLKEVKKAADCDGEILSAKVRGRFVTFVYQTEDGRLEKGAVERADLGKKAEKPAEDKEQVETKPDPNVAPKKDDSKK